jgi:hypothetical protein
MTIKTSASAQPRIRPIPEHVYTLPVVRELPAQHPGPLDAHSLW